MNIPRVGRAVNTRQAGGCCEIAVEVEIGRRSETNDSARGQQIWSLTHARLFDTISNTFSDRPFTATMRSSWAFIMAWRSLSKRLQVEKAPAMRDATCAQPQPRECVKIILHQPKLHESRVLLSNTSSSIRSLSGAALEHTAPTQVVGLPP